MDLPQENNSVNQNKPKKRLWSNFWLSLRIRYKKIFRSRNKEGEFNRTQADKKLIYSLAPSKIPNRRQLKHLKKFLTPKENIAVKSLVAVIIISVVFLGWEFYKTHLQVVPARGGEYTEGLVGAPKYVNPLYAFSDVDSDLSYLIYSRLFKYDGQGNLVPDLVKDYSISDDGKTYTISLIENVKWHNNDKLTANDVVFTFQAIKNPDFRSPWLNVFSGVEITQVNDYTFTLTLNEPYAGFLELLTFGILSEKLWMNINPENANLAEFNLKPIGSGPYKFKSLLKNKAGYIKEYTLESNQDYYVHEPYIETLHFKFYPDFASTIVGLNADEVDGISYLPLDQKSSIIGQNSLNFNYFALPQADALFFNSANNAVLESKDIRQALAMALDKNKIVAEVFGDEASVIKGPILSNSFAYDADLSDYAYDINKANELLDKAGWGEQSISSEDLSLAKAAAAATAEKVEIAVNNEEEDNTTKETEAVSIPGLEKLETLASSTPLTVEGSWRYKEKNNDREYLVVTLTVVNNSKDLAVAKAVKDAWAEIGVNTIIQSVESSEIQAKIIKPQKFEILLYGQLLGFDPDPFAYWHSDGNLNVINYSDDDVDKLLEEARINLDQTQRIEKYKKFQQIIHDDIPAIFLYSPNYIYPQTKKVKGLYIQNILDPKNRFSNIIDWHLKVKNKLSF